jgi:bifunctional non-homologous end joining protein LigD
MADGLSKYRSMRDFKSTPEPRGKARKSKSGRLFIVQKHDATRLHYDFRLELDGVLLSWAVTRGPSLNPADKRLAVQTEDHPIEYGGFEGVIPSGYGAGTVMLWDRGEWLPQGDPHEGLKKGELKFVLYGERLKGGFVLVRLKPKPGEKPGRHNWLLIKERDDWVDESIIATEAWTTSVKSKRSLDRIEKEGEAYKRGKMYAPEEAAPANKPAKKKTVTAAVKKGAAKTSPAKKPVAKSRRAAPGFVAPQLALLKDAPPQGEGWLHEIKFDGYRIIAVIKAGKVSLWTRNQLDWTHKYGRIAEQLARLKLKDAVLDGELVALDDKGEAAFSKIQAAGENPSIPLKFYVFDLLNLEGEDLRHLPLIERKERLKGILARAPDNILYSDHIQTEGDQVLASACSMKLEGVISKRADAPYTSGRSSGDWVKSKCIGNDEFVIGGFRKSDKAGRPFSSLILGEYDRGKLIYRGRVGTGFDDETFALLKPKFARLVRKTSPFEEEPSEARSGAVWLEPTLVAQIAYLEKTPDGHLRHPSYLGLREDKSAREVTVARAAAKAKKATERIAARARATTGKKTSARRAAGRKPAKKGDGVIPPSGVRLTSPEKVLWPDTGITKQDLAAYYATHADIILPHVKDRPLSIVRCPDGASSECFFQKHHNASTPEGIETVGIREKDGSTAQYLVIRTRKGLIAAAQISALELHVWGCRAHAIENPERIVFDLDPDEGLGFAQVRAAALEVRDVLASLGLTTFPMLTGGKGIHVIAPIARKNTWVEVKAFSQGVAKMLAAAAPDRYVANMSKAKRRGRIFVDYLRNERGSTAIAPFSPRRRPGATVATPIAWRELPRMASAAEFTMDTIDRRLASLRGDPWEGYAIASRQHNSGPPGAIRRPDQSRRGLTLIRPRPAAPPSPAPPAASA